MKKVFQLSEFINNKCKSVDLVNGEYTHIRAFVSDSKQGV